MEEEEEDELDILGVLEEMERNQIEKKRKNGKNKTLTQNLSERFVEKSFEFDVPEGNSLIPDTWVKNIAETPLKRWTKYEMCKWIQKLDYSIANQNMLKSWLKEQKMDGIKVLTTSNSKILSNLIKFIHATVKGGTRGLGFVLKSFPVCLNHLKEVMIYDPQWYFVFFKTVVPMRKLMRKNFKVPSLSKFEQLADLLSDKEAFFEYYFQPYLDALKETKDYSTVQDRAKLDERTIEKKEIFKKKVVEEEKMALEDSKETENGGGDEKEETEREEVDGEIEVVFDSEEEKYNLELSEKYHDVDSKEVASHLFQAFRSKGVDFKTEFESVKLKSQVGNGFRKISLNQIKQHFDFRIKIVVSEIFGDEDPFRSPKKKNKTVSTFLSKIPFIKGPKSGVFHTAVAIGPWYVEWHQGQIAAIRSFCGRKAFFEIDILEKPIPFEDQEELIHKLADFIYLWNTTMKYSQLRYPNRRGNCQHFVEDCLKGLNIDCSELEKSEIWKNFFKAFKRKGEGKVIFAPGLEFAEKFNLKKKYLHKTFTRHKRFDKFVNNQLLNVDMNFQKNNPIVYRFLRAIDQGFWLRNLRSPDKKAYKCLAKKGDCHCPFRDPKGSFTGSSNVKL